MLQHHSARVYVLPLSLIATLLGCNTSSTSTSVSPQPTDTTAPTVSSTSPVDGATDVETSSVVTATFDEDIFAITVDSTSFTLLGNGNVSGTVSFDGSNNTATFTPNATLGPLTTHTATLTSAITDLSGNPLGNDFTWSFTTADGTWGVAELVEVDNPGTASSPQIAFDANGNALAVWYQRDGTRYDIWSNRYEAGTGWGTPELIETDNAGDADSPQIAFDVNGNALAVWRQDDGMRYNIWSNRYEAGTGWGTAVLIEADDAGPASSPQIAFDINGNALAVWRQNDGIRWNIWSNRYESGTGWGTAVLIETEDAGSAESPQIAIDANGNALAVWSQSDGTRYNIWSNRYEAGTGWGTAVLIEADDVDQAFNPQIAIDANGNALAVWSQSDGTRYNIWSNRYEAGTGWGMPELIETDNAANALIPQIAIDANGNALAVWRQNDGIRWNIWSNRYEAGTGWGAAVLIETDNAGDADRPQIAIDANGNALAVWIQSDGARNNILSNRYVAGTGWGAPELIETDNAGGADRPQIAIDAYGRALAVWQQSDGTRVNIWSNRFE